MTNHITQYCLSTLHVITHYTVYKLHCSQRAPIENVWSTSGIFKSGIFKADTDNYRKYL